MTEAGNSDKDWRLPGSWIVPVFAPFPSAGVLWLASLVLGGVDIGTAPITRERVVYGVFLLLMSAGATVLLLLLHSSKVELHGAKCRLYETESKHAKERDQWTREQKRLRQSASGRANRSAQAGAGSKIDQSVRSTITLPTPDQSPLITVHGTGHLERTGEELQAVFDVEIKNRDEDKYLQMDRFELEFSADGTRFTVPGQYRADIVNNQIGPKKRFVGGVVFDMPTEYLGDCELRLLYRPNGSKSFGIVEISGYRSGD